MKLSDADKTARVAAALAEKYPAPRFAPMWECADSTGWSSGYADLLVMHLWHSDRMRLEGYEIKASRGDLKRELERPGKWRKIGRYCHRWTLAVYEGTLVDGFTLPPEWGLVSLGHPHGDHVGELVTLRKATLLEAEPWPRHFAAAMIRRAVTQCPNAAFTGEAVRRALESQRSDLDFLRRSDLERSFRDAWFAARGLEYSPWPGNDENERALTEYLDAWQAWKVRQGWAA